MDLCRALEAGARFDLIFLDIMFAKDEIDGVEAGRFIRETRNDNDVSIVYISWEGQYAVDASETRPMRFMTKPLTCEQVEKTVKTYLTTPHGGGVVFEYRKNRITHRVPIRNIVYLEARDRKIVLHLSDGGRDEFYGTLKDVYDQQLESLDFIHIHAAYAVNFDHITMKRHDSLDVAGRVLPVGRSRMTDVKARYLEISLRRRG